MLSPIDRPTPAIELNLFWCLTWDVGIWAPHADGTDVNSVDRDLKLGVLATGDDKGRIKLFRYTQAIQGWTTGVGPQEKGRGRGMRDTRRD